MWGGGGGCGVEGGGENGGTCVSENNLGQLSPVDSCSYFVSTPVWAWGGGGGGGEVRGGMNLCC